MATYPNSKPTRFWASKRRLCRARPWPLLLFILCILTDLACANAGPDAATKGKKPPYAPGPSSDPTCAQPVAGASPFPTDLPPAKTISAGTARGTFSVLPTGEATYTIPIVIPPGRAGMQPSLAVTYDSASGNGPLGKGFSLSGLSSVTRCPRTMAQDGILRGLTYTSADALCLDGQRLVLVKSVPGIEEYRTLPDTFTKVLAYYPAGWDRNSGPEHLQAFTRSGLIVELGATADSRATAKGGVIRTYFINQSTDRNQNSILYSYQNDQDPNDGHTTEIVPEKIRYTDHPSAPASREIDFLYDAKPPAAARTLFMGGMALTSAKLLTKIRTLGPGANPVQEVRLSYLPGGGGGTELLLSALKECAADGACKPPTTFGWNVKTPGFTQVTTPIPVPQSALASVMPLDVNGDGLDDLVVPDVHMIGGAQQPFTDYKVAINAGPGKPLAKFFPASSVALTLSLGAPLDPTAPSPVYAPELGTPIDYNHDGLTDIFLHDIDGQYAHWQVLLAQPNHTFKRIDTGVLRVFGIGVNTPPRLAGPDASAHLADVTGDGMADLIQCANTGIEYEWSLRPWTPAGPGFSKAALKLPDVMSIFPCDIEFYPIDVDLDGKVNVVVRDVMQVSGPNGPETKLRDNYVAFTHLHDDLWSAADLKLLPPPPGGALFFLDANGDGLPDAVETGFPNGQPRTALNTGGGFAPPLQSLAVPSPSADQFASLAAPIDYNGDGLEDLLLPMPLNGGGVPSWVVLQSAGDGTFTVVPTAIPFDAKVLSDAVSLSDPHGPRVADVDGDGAGDVILPVNGFFNVFRSAAGDQDLLVSVTDGMSDHDPEEGYEPTLAISYEDLVDYSITNAVAPGAPVLNSYSYVSRYDAGNGCDYPVRCVVGPRRVVGQYQVNNGKGQLRHFMVRVRDGRYDRLGRRFLGFGERVVEDLDTGASTTEIYDNTTFDPAFNAFPYAGEVVREQRWSPGLPSQPDPDKVELSYTSRLWETVPTNGGKTYFTLPVSRRVRRDQGFFPGGQPDGALEEYVRDTEIIPADVLGQTIEIVSDVDAYGNILGEITTTAGVDLALKIRRVFTNDPVSWRIGELTELHECSGAAQGTQCRTTTRFYDGQGRVWTESRGSDDGDPETQLTVKYKYDVFGNVIKTTADDAFGSHRAACVSYDLEGVFPYVRKNAVGHRWVTKFDPGLGVETAEIDPNDLLTQWAHDGFGRTTKELRADGTATTTTLSRTRENGRWTVKTATKTDGFGEETAQFDSLGRVIRRWTPGVSVDGKPVPRIMQETVFDDLGEHVAARSVPASELTPLGDLRYDQFAFDATGRVVEHTAPWGAVTSYAYNGNQTVTQRSKGATTIALHDALGRPVSIQDNVGTTSYTYGPFGGLWSVTDPGSAVTTTERDAYGRVTKTVDPDRGTTVAHHDGFDQPTWSTDAQNRTTTLYHDPLGRLVGRSDDGAWTSWIWDTAPHGVGKIAEVSSPEGVVEQTKYDTFSRPASHRLSLGGESFSMGFGYDPLGRVGTITYPDAGGVPFAVQQSYDADGHLLAVGDASTSYWTLQAADGAGRIALEKFGNGVVTTRGYDEARDRVSSISTSKSKPFGGARQDLAYAYDDRLNLTSRTDMLQGGMSEMFWYDKVDRLTCASFAAKFERICPHAVEYWPNGNIHWTMDDGLYTYDPAHPHAVQKVGAAVYGYDATGNQTSRPGATIAYTAFDKPSVITLNGGGKVTLDYSGDQQRVRKTTAETETVYVGDFYERVTHKDTGLVEHRYYVHSSERAVAMVVRPEGGASATRYIHVDNMGSVDVITDELGAEVERRSYDAFGARRSPTWGKPLPAAFASATARGFTWHEQDEELGLVNMKGRIYDPKLRRFLTPDSIVSMPWFGQSWNAYSYVLNNPLAYTDPSGFEPEGHWQVSEYWVNGYPGLSRDWVPAEQDPGRDRTESQEEAAREAIQTMTQVRPVDVGTTGNTAGFVPQNSPTAPAQSTFDNRIGELALGVTIGIGKLLLGAAKFALLNAVTLGGYGTYSLGKALWAGYKEDGLLGAANALNPLYAIARGGADTYLAADRGDYRAAGEAGATAVVLGAATVAGAGEAASALEEGALAREAAAAEAAETGAAGAVPDLPPYAGGKTTGVLRTGAGDVPLKSGYNGPSAAMPRGTPGMNGNIKSHVEAHAASVMRQQGLGDATLYINRVPCPGANGCAAMLPRMLPEGAQLRVIGPDGYDKIFTGLQD